MDQGIFLYDDLMDLISGSGGEMKTITIPMTDRETQHESYGKYQQQK